MSTLQNVATTLRAISFLPVSTIWAQAMRRLRNRLVPIGAASYRAMLRHAAEGLPAYSPGPTALVAAGAVARFLRDKQKANAEDCLSGRFTFLNRTIDFGSIEGVDWRVRADAGNHQLWRSNLGFMGYLCAAAERNPQQALDVGARLARSFLKAADFSRQGDFAELWHPYGASQRSLALAATLTIVPTELRDTDAWRELERFLRLNIAFVMRNLETDLGLNHLERNLSALCLFWLGADDPPVALVTRLRKLVMNNLRQSIGGDGVQLERSAMYQGLTVQSLEIFRALPFLPASDREWIEGRLLAVKSALAALTLGDGQPALFNDAWIGETPATESIVGTTGVGFRVMRDAGYARLANDEAVVILDAGPIGVDSNPGHGHADFLAVEVSIGSERFIVDPGVFSYSAGGDAGSTRMDTRRWRAHNGPAFTEAEPVAFRGSFKVGKRAAARLEEAEQTGDRQTVTGSFAFRRYSVRRRIVLTDDALEIRDTWLEGAGPRASRFLIPAAWAVNRLEKGLEFHRDGHRVLFSIGPQARARIGEARWSRYYNVWERAHEVVCTPRAGECHIRITWTSDMVTALRNIDTSDMSHVAAAPAFLNAGGAARQASEPLATCSSWKSRSTPSLSSILAFPKAQSKGSALYNALLYGAIEDLGVEVRNYRRFIRAPLNTDVFHFHWPDRVFGGASKLHEAIGSYALNKFSDTISDFNRSGRSVVWTVHNFHPHDFPKEHYRRLFAAMDRRLIKDINGFIFLSHHSKARFLEDNPTVSNDQCTVIPHMITPIHERIGATHAPVELTTPQTRERPMFLGPGHIRRYKDIEGSIEVFDRIKSPGDLFVIAGPPSDPAYLAELQVRCRGRDDIVFIARILSEQEMNWCYQNARAVLSLRAADSNSGVLFSALSNQARVLVNAGPVAWEIGELVGPGWIIDVDTVADGGSRALACSPVAAASLSWGDPTLIAKAHLEFMGNL